MAHTRRMLEKEGYMHVRACTRPCAQVPTRTHRPICNAYCFSKATMICERASVLLYTYSVCLVLSDDDLRSSKHAANQLRTFTTGTCTMMASTYVISKHTLYS